MTALLISVLGFFLAYGVYIATLTARRAPRAEDYLDAGGDLPGWCYIFAGTGLLIACLGLYDHYLLIATFGFQYNHVAVGLILAGLAGALVQKRLWLAARITGTTSLAELLGAYYRSNALRTLLFLLLLLFAVPFAAQGLSRIGTLVEVATAGGIPRATALWACGFFLFLGGVIGGWRAVVYTVAAQALLMLGLLTFMSGVGVLELDWSRVFEDGIPVPSGMLAGEIPGVIQYSAGVGKEATVGGIWTTVAIVSTGLVFIGVVLNPAFVLLGNTSRGNGAFAFMQVWMSSGLAAGALLLLAPVVGAGVGLAAMGGEAVGYAGVINALANLDGLIAAGFVLMLFASLQIAVVVFTQAGANLFVSDLLGRFLLPDLDGRGRRLAARIALAVIYLLAALLAAFLPLIAEALGSVALPLAAQLLPAVIGLCWVRWISRGAVIAGLVFGILFVLFTEPLGLILFEGLFLELPWGRWPLTIHSAAWGLVFNVAFCLLVCIFTRRAPEREHRERLHDVFRRDHRQDFGGPASRGAKWSLILIWAFLALGPGAILGNSFFSEPVFSGATLALGVPSLWVWQIAFWFIGVFLVWWIAYQSRLAVIDADATATLSLHPARRSFERRTPLWLAQFLERVARR